jgi:Phosphotransferase system, mannose/fructose/N-acetylgalactosamine-specific component IIC
LFTKIILLSFCGGLLCLDRIFIQAMISRPIIIAPIIGLILNNPYAGLIIGAMIEMFWIDRIPIGIYIPPNDSLVAVLATSVAILAGQKLGSVSPELIAFSILLFIPFGIMAQQIDIMIIKSNDILSDQALEDAKKSNIRGIEQKTYLGLIKVLSFYIIYLLILQAIFIPAVIWVYPKLTSTIIKMLTMIYYFLPLLGIAVAINTIKLRGAIPVFCAIFLIIAVSLEFFHVF